MAKAKTRQAKVRKLMDDTLTGELLEEALKQSGQESEKLDKGPSDSVPETQKDDPDGDTPDRKAAEDPDQKATEDAREHTAQTWPESWSGATAWGSWGNFGWNDWSWGAGWYDRDWNCSQQALSEEHLHWRNRSESLQSGSFGSQATYDRKWSQGSLATPPYKRSASVDSELAAAFQRLDTVDRLLDNELPQVAKTLDKSFDEAVTPDKKAISAPTSTTATAPTPDIGPDNKKTPQTQTTEDKTTEATEAAATMDGGKSEKTDKKDDEGSKAAKKAADQVEKKKAAHARYMRYWRSVHGGAPKCKKTPTEIRKMGAGAKGGYLVCMAVSTNLPAKFGVENADAIVLRKLNDDRLRDTEVKKHPDLPDAMDMMQFLIFDSEVEIDQEEEVMEMLYKLAEGDDSGNSMSSDSTSEKKQKKDKKDKKQKKVGVGRKDKKQGKKTKKDKDQDQSQKELKQAIAKAGKKIQEKVELDKQSAQMLWEAEQNLKQARSDMQNALDTKESLDAVLRLATLLNTAITGFEQAATVIKGQAKPKAKAKAEKSK
ncbi:unnamed protein product [Symbiodinium sp. CCMP2456]|nr:unnamed protein product [Symbiodinium sp. CCMP2456]